MHDVSTAELVSLAMSCSGVQSMGAKLGPLHSVPSILRGLTYGLWSYGI